jgi:hypothetical protein
MTRRHYITLLHIGSTRVRVPAMTVQERARCLSYLLIIATLLQWPDFAIYPWLTTAARFVLAFAGLAGWRIIKDALYTPVPAPDVPEPPEES